MAVPTPGPWESFGATMDSLHVPAATWGQEIKSYEREKRRVVDEGLMGGQQLRLPKGVVQQQERLFDPLLQRFRDVGSETRHRLSEERERVVQLNRAQDVHIMRSQPFNIINHTSKLEALVPGQDPERLGGQKGHATMGNTMRKREGRPVVPPTLVDYNIVSNLPFDVHHWQNPGERPHVKERQEKVRKVQPFLVKDFNILTNKYLEDHDTKLSTEKRLNLLEATEKYNKNNRFDPLSQTFTDPMIEERAKVILDARDAETSMRFDAQLPPSYKGRLSNHYGIISHKDRDPDMLRLWDTLEDERKDRHKNRYIVEHNLHVQDVKHDHITAVRKLNRVAPERFDEEKRRGYDIIDNRAHGQLPKEKQIHEDFTTRRLTPWEKSLCGRCSEQRSSSSEPAGDNVRTLRLDREHRSGLQSSASSPQLSGHQSVNGARHASSTASGRSAGSRRCGASTASRGSVAPSRSSATLGATIHPRSLAIPPAAPSIPGHAVGSVFSHNA